MSAATAWRRVWEQPASLPDLWRITRMTGTSSSSRRLSAPSNPWHLLQFLGTSSRSLSESAGWRRRRQTAWKGRRIHALREPARLFHPGLGQARLFSTADQQQRQTTTKQHLYLVLDDRQNGFTIHKLDMDLDVGYDPDGIDAPLSLPEPPVICLGPPTMGKFAQFAALGSHIIAVCPCTTGMSMVEEGFDGATVIFDTKTSVFSVADILPSKLPFGYEAAIAVGNRLYVLESSTDTNDGSNGLYFSGGLHCLAADPNDNERHWPWQPLSDDSQFSWSWTVNPPKFPFDPKSITAYGMHPCTGTILLSASGFESSGTFSYGSGGSGQWKRLGDWVLPFKGPAHYDNVLGAWVGLHLRSLQTEDTNGYLCACPVMANGQPPKWKVCTKKLFMQHPWWRHVDAKLVYMGEGSKYCLMERLTYKGAGNMIYAIRLTTFTVIYGEDGELKTMPYRPARFYKAPSYLFKFDVQAFWM